METGSSESENEHSFKWSNTLIKLSLIAVFIILINIGFSQVADRFEVQIWPEHLQVVDRVVWLGIILYIAMMAIPFLPGIEIGLILMLMLGPKGVLVVYIGTLVALSISFGIGRLFPTTLLAALMRWLHLTRAESLLREFDAIPPENRMEILVEKTSSPTMVKLLKRRYLSLAVLLNLPGNALLGGGGGIAMLAGMCRLYSFPKYLMLIAAAVLPGPILIFLSKLI